MNPDRDTWYHKSLQDTEWGLLLESKYTNNDLAIEWMNHFILHTKSTLTSNLKVLLLDSHNSHHTYEFVQLAKQNNIFIYTFPSHLTHILQPLDVEIFQLYKH